MCARRKVTEPRGMMCLGKGRPGGCPGGTEGGGMPFRSCFRSSSAAVPQQFRSSSAAAPQQLRSRSVLPPQSFRVTSAVVPCCYLRSRSVLPPQSFRVTSAFRRSSTDETPAASPPPSVGYAHGGRFWLSASTTTATVARESGRVSRREPRDGRVQL